MDLTHTIYRLINGIKVFALVGPSGTGKSFRSTMLLCFVNYFLKLQKDTKSPEMNRNGGTAFVWPPGLIGVTARYSGIL